MATKEEQLEEARAKILKKNATDKDRANFRRLSKEVTEARVAERQEREAAGPPNPENDGDAVVRASRR